MGVANIHYADWSLRAESRFSDVPQYGSPMFPLSCFVITTADIKYLFGFILAIFDWCAHWSLSAVHGNYKLLSNKTHPTLEILLKEQFLQTVLLATVALESKIKMVGFVKCEHIQIQNCDSDVDSSGLL